MPAHDGPDHEPRLLRAMALIGGFVLVELAGGLLSGSLALIADAGHMLADFMALLLAWCGFRLGRRPTDQRRSYGYYRLEVLAAFVNGLLLAGVAGWVLYEAVLRIAEPTEVAGPLMLGVAAAGLAVNLVALRLLRASHHDDLNLRAAAAHVLGDLLGSLGAVVAALVIVATGFTTADTLVSAIVALLILRSAWAVLQESTHILLEGTPGELDLEWLSSDLQRRVAGVQDVHHVHAWSLTSRRTLITLHVTVGRDADPDDVLGEVSRFLSERWRLQHATIQVERGPCPAEPQGR